MNILEYNRYAWDQAVAMGSRWTIPVEPDMIAEARQGKWQIVLTPTRPVPQHWFPPFERSKILCLAAGGGQQGPILAAAGESVATVVTVLDNSPRQLQQDKKVAAQNGLRLETVLGNMADLSCFDNEQFDLIVHPCSNLFVPDVHPVWQECYRVLAPGGVLLAGFCNPVMYIFDFDLADQGFLEVRFNIPYSDLKSLPAEVRKRYQDDDQALEWGHSLEDQIGGQLDAGFVINGFYEDSWEGTALHGIIDAFAATRSQKPT